MINPLFLPILSISIPIIMLQGIATIEYNPAINPAKAFEAPKLPAYTDMIGEINEVSTMPTKPRKAIIGIKLVVFNICLKLITIFKFLCIFFYIIV